MIEIDGSFGEGGGQIIRSSLALAAVTGRAFSINNIRAGRKKSGLKRQHVVGVKAAAQICDAKVTGAELESSQITFEPGPIRGGNFRFQINSAGSTTLVAQTVLPALMLAEERSTVSVTGGTHNPGGPPFDFLQRVYVPQLNKFGPQVSANLQSHGFYPAGGGEIELTIEPAKKLNGIELLKRSGKPTPKVTAIVSSLPRHIAERECDVIRRKSNWNSSCFEIVEVRNPVGPGNVVLIELASENVSAMFTEIGRQGVTAERVARSVYRQASAHLEAEIPVGEFLADQILLPMGLAAAQGQQSCFKTGSLSSHSETHIEILKRFLDISIETEVVESDKEKSVIVRVGPR